MATFNFLKMEYWTTEPETLAWFDFLCKDAKLIVDVGAEIGYYTKRAMLKAPFQCKIHSYEPDPDAYALLSEGVKAWERKRLALHPNKTKMGEVLLHEAAVTLPGPKTVQVHTGKKSSRCRTKPPKWTVASYDVPATTLDSIYLKRRSPIDILKIDTEGDEINVLKGAKGLLEKQKIKHVLLEIHYPMITAGEGDTIRQIMADCGYTETQIETPGPWEDNGNVSYLYSRERVRSKDKPNSTPVPTMPHRCSECMSLIDPKKIKERKAWKLFQEAKKQED